jgi:hypothetical protein
MLMIFPEPADNSEESRISSWKPTQFTEKWIKLSINKTEEQ